jgi:SAM-dependent methyltransferase
MDRRRISAIAHQDHPIASPLGEVTVRGLLGRAITRGDERVLDLGCAEGAWLVHALNDHPGIHAEGVDIDAETIAEARVSVDEAGLSDRLTLHAMDAKEYTSPHQFDVVLNVGSTHAFDGMLATLEAASKHLTSGGRVLLGECFWEREPNQVTLDAGFTADEYDDLATTVDRITDAGWTPVYGHVSTMQEWDDYEWSWTGTVSRWALDHPDDPDHQDALEAAEKHRHTWLHGYRGTLGFVTLLLRRSA